MNGRIVTEATRERETFKYDPSLLSDTIYNEEGRPIPNTELRTSHDSVLTSIASLGASRLKTAASLVSLFDGKWQYIVAEATPTLSLLPSLRHDERNGEQLWLCGTAIPRSEGVCEHTLASQDAKDFEEVGEFPTDLPLSLVTDLGADPRHCQKPYCLPGSPARFYAAVPIRTKRNINIGVYCVIDTVPRSDWNTDSTKLMRELSRTIMEYLELRRSKHEYRRSGRMTRGLGSFVEGRSTTTSWQAAKGDIPGKEGNLNANQQSIEHRKDLEAYQESIQLSMSPQSPSVEQVTGSVSSKQAGQDPSVYTVTYSPQDRRSSTTTSSGEPQTVNGIFSKAANIIRESIEIEGTLFLDANMKTFGGLTMPPGYDGQTDVMDSASSPSESDEARSSGPLSGQSASNPCCSVLGFSTSDSSSVDGADNISRHINVPEKLLSALLRHYPRGKIFNFDAHGGLESSDSSGSEHDLTLPLSDQAELLEPRLRRTKTWARQGEAVAISDIFPGARSVAFVPVWNTKKDRWYAGCFAFTNNPTRVLTIEGELSYLRGFGMLAMSETFRLEATLTSRAQSDVLSSLSHELRSPLHGVVLGVELLHDTQLDVFQGDVLHTLETCGRTLLDTMDHLLDFAKINNYVVSEKKKKRGLRLDRNASIEDGMKSLYSDVRLDILVEEVMESVFAGFNFQHLSVAQIARRDTRHTDRDSNKRLDTMQALEDLGPGMTQMQLRDVCVYLDIDHDFPWKFNVTPGAIRRILMNLFGNSLKYTQNGTIRVSLTQEVTSNKPRSRQRMVKIAVSDSGKGISEEFLRNELFKPFTQEDTLSPGTGLGLSLVKQIVTSLDGKISMKSGARFGTTVTVVLPLTQVVSSTPSSIAINTDEESEFDGHLQHLRGLRIRLDGFKQPPTRLRKRSNEQDLDGYTAMVGICQNWLGMQIIPEGQIQEPSPDLIVCTETSLGNIESNHPPTVVVCANALVAYRHITSPDSANRHGILEFTSQPVGPRKLAKILSMAFGRKHETQSLPLTVEDKPAILVERPNDVLPIPVRSTPTDQHQDPDCLPSQTQVTEVPRRPITSPIYVASPDSENITFPFPTQAEPLELAIATNLSNQPAQDAPPQSEEVDFLIVDDNPINLTILASYMKKLNRRYDTASNGLEAVNAYREDPRRYKCIFMDISMPIMDGFEATRQIRALEHEKSLVPAFIFALSGLASADAQQEAFASGINLFLTKPVRLKELSSILTTRGLL